MTMLTTLKMNLFSPLFLQWLLLALLLLTCSTETALAQNSEVTDNLSPEQLDIIAAAREASVQCPEFQANFTFPNTPITMFYSVVVSPSTEDTDGGNSRGFLRAQVIYERDQPGWIGLGVSPGGNMVGSLAAIGLPSSSDGGGGTVGLYSLSSQFVSGVTLLPDEEQTLFNKTLTQNETHTVMTISKLLTHGDNDDWTIHPNGVNNFIVAGGFENSLGTHLHRASARVTLEPCTAVVDGTSTGGGVESIALDNKESLFKAHGILMAIAWGILAPLAIGMPLNRHLLSPKGGPPLWLYLHQGLNSLVVVFTAIAFGLVYKAVEDTGGGDSHFQAQDGTEGKHKPIGLVVFILAMVQALGGALRPHLPHRDEETGEFTEPVSTVRQIWQVVHRVGGIALLAMAWFNCHSGIELYAARFFNIDSDKYTDIFWGVALSLWGLVFLGHLSKFIMGKQEEKEETETKKTPNGDGN